MFMACRRWPERGDDQRLPRSRPAGSPSRRRAVSAALAIVGSILAAAPAVAEDPSAGDAWRFQATLYGWATAVDGDVGVRRLPTTSVDTPFSTVLKNLDGAFMGAFVARKGRWMVLADIVVARLSHESTVGRFGGSRLDARLTETFATGAIGYLLPIERPDLEVAVTAGARYSRIRGELTFKSNLLPRSRSADQARWWIDPTIGLVARWAFVERWFLSTAVDVGGFGVGSQISSNGYLGVGYEWTDALSTTAGYRYLYQDYDGPGAKVGRFRYDTLMHGPTLGLNWRF